MASKKRSHNEMLPVPSNADNMLSSGSKLDADLLKSVETLSKRPKLAEEARTKGPLENALAALVVEPCEYSEAHESMHHTMPQRMVGREKEYDLIEAHYTKSLVQKVPRPLFICGAPGCGKSATVHKILTSFTLNLPTTYETSQMAPYTVRVNCATDLSSSKPTLLYFLIASRMIEAFNASSLAAELGTIEMPTFENSREISEISRLQLVVTKLNKLHLTLSKQTDNHKPLLVPVFLDEIDHILSSKTSFSKELHFLFSSWVEPWNIMSIVCISNDRDLFERSLPLLSQFTAKNTEETIETLQFNPYTVEQLEQILDSRMGLKSSLSTSGPPITNPNTLSIFDIKAKKFLCAKIAKLPGDQAGDVRILVDLAKSCILDAITRSKTLITLDIVLNIWKIKMTSQTSADPIAPLPLLQKCVLISLIVASKSTSSHTNIRPITIETAWKSVSKQVFISSPPDLAELWRAVELLESIGHVQIVHEKGNRKSYKLQNGDLIKKSLSQDPIFNGFL